MAISGFNVLWILCVLFLLVAFFLAYKRRRLASRQQNVNPMNATVTTHHIRHTFNEVRIHMARSDDPNQPYNYYYPQPPQPPPPSFDPEEPPPPPPSYQNYNKDVLLQSQLPPQNHHSSS